MNSIYGDMKSFARIFIHDLMLFRANSFINSAIAQAVDRRALSMIALVQSQVSSYGIYGGQYRTPTGFLRVLRFHLPVPINQMLHFSCISSRVDAMGHLRPKHQQTQLQPAAVVIVVLLPVSKN
jgi:hypothetical protein